MQKKYDIFSFFVFLFGVIFIYILSFTDIQDFRKIIRILSYFYFLLGIVIYFKSKCSKKANDEILTKHKYFNENVFTTIVIIFYSIHFFYIHEMHHRSFFLGDMDYISMAEVLNNTIKGDFFQTNYHGNVENSNYLSHHFSPSIIFLSPFLYLNELRLGYGFGLLFFNIITLFALKTYLLEKKISRQSFYFFFSFFLINLYVYRLFQSYHFELMFLTFSILLFLYLYKQKYFLVIVLYFLCIFIKEDISIYFSLFGIFLIFNNQKKIGIFFTIFSVLYFLILLPRIFSFFDNAAKVNWALEWNYWGNTQLEIALNMVANPEKILSILIQKKNVILEISLSLAFLFYLFPKILIIIIPIFLFHFTSSRMWFNEFYNYYIYSLLPFIIFGSVEGFKKLENSLSKKNISLIPISLLLFSISLFRSSNDKLFPFKTQNFDKQKYQTAKEISKFIPKNATVSVQFDLSGFIPKNNKIFPLTKKSKDFILVNHNGFSPYLSLENIDHLILDVQKQNKYQKVFQRDGIILLQKKF